MKPQHQSTARGLIDAEDMEVEERERKGREARGRHMMEEMREEDGMAAEETA